MKKTSLVHLIALAIVFLLVPVAVRSQGFGYRGGYGMGPGMMGGYGMGPGMMEGWNDVEIPPKLPAPKDMEWVSKLKAVFILEKQSLAQYESDQEKFNASMPYMMIIPQEENHVQWIEQLFAAYGMSSDTEKPAGLVVNKTLEQSYALGAKLESDLLPLYEWLVRKAEDPHAARILNAILLQSRWHLVMFEHASRMGHGYGYSMGSGMMGGYGMGPGMMWQYGLGYGRSSKKPIGIKEAETMLKDYIASSRNPNVKLGKIKDVGNAYEAEILTKNNALVDRVLIDKYSGWIRSVY